MLRPSSTTSSFSQISQRNSGAMKQRRFEEGLNRAIAQNEIFEIDSFYPMYTFPLMCEELGRRGWKQKLSLDDVPKKTSQVDVAELKHAAGILKNVSPNFIWTWIDFNKDKYKNFPYYNRLISRHHDANFTLKTGLATIYQRIHWFDFSTNDAYVLPRCYPYSDADELEAFSQDYRLTVCLSFLYELSRRPNLADMFSMTGKQTTDCVKFALDKVRVSIDKKQHIDIDKDYAPFSHPQTYRNYRYNYHDILVDNEKMRIDDHLTPFEYIQKIKCTVLEAQKYFPYLNYDGFHNIWIVKPASWDCGTGIKLFDDEDKIKEYIRAQQQDVDWVIQKYIERPLLIYNTKFDFRQYFLITMDDQYINLWFYKSSYFRFSGHEYNLEELDEKIHLTNHAVQVKQANGPRSPNLPEYNAWTLEDFLSYLNHIGQFSMWKSRIYPGMVQCIMTVVHATIDETIYWKNNFQLFGADFMITDSYLPILIEINPGPHLTLTNPATQIVNTNIVKDLLRGKYLYMILVLLFYDLHIPFTVIIDYPKDPKCSTGDFEQVWQISKTPSYENSTLRLQIEPCKRNIDPKNSPAMDILKQYDENKDDKLPFQLENIVPAIEQEHHDHVIIAQSLNIDPADIDINPLSKAKTISKPENELLILKRSSSTLLPTPANRVLEIPKTSITSNLSNESNKQRGSTELRRISVPARQSYTATKSNNIEKKRSILKISTDESRSSKDSTKRVNFSIVSMAPIPSSQQKFANAQNNYMGLKEASKLSGPVVANAKSIKTNGNKLFSYTSGPSNPKSKPKRSSSDSITKVMKTPRNSQQSLAGMGIQQKAPISKQLEYKKHIDDLNKLMAVRAVPTAKPKRKPAKLPDNYFFMQNKNQAYTMPSVTGSTAISIRRSNKGAPQNLSSILTTNRNLLLSKMAIEPTDKKHPLSKTQVTMNRRTNEYIENLLRETKNISNNTITRKTDNSRNSESIFKGSNQLPFSVPLDKLRPNRKY